jgi:hypothetical protein
MATKKIGLIARITRPDTPFFKGFLPASRIAVIPSVNKDFARATHFRRPIFASFNLNVSSTYHLQRWVVSFCDDRGQASSFNEALRAIKVLFGQHESHPHTFTAKPSAQSRRQPEAKLVPGCRRCVDSKTPHINVKVAKN